MKLDPFLSAYTQLDTRWIKKFGQTRNHENTRKTFRGNACIGNDFCGRPQKYRQQKQNLYLCKPSLPIYK